MELKEVRCGNCGREIIVLESYVKKEMFCTLGCLKNQKGCIQEKNETN
jgi:hypothetical protein